MLRHGIIVLDASGPKHAHDHRRGREKLPTKASRRMDGKAMRRLAVKKSARDQLVWRSARREERRAVLDRQAAAFADPLAIKPTANSRIAAAIDTKMSLNR